MESNTVLRHPGLLAALAGIAALAAGLGLCLAVLNRGPSSDAGGGLPGFLAGAVGPALPRALLSGTSVRTWTLRSAGTATRSRSGETL